ncbi:MAG: trypsin-like peptidase domain-containing protein [Clostridia bacterium]|nr:trypsin-like peptidase domain-containing protein [Clostridia bacterium]
MKHNSLVRTLCLAALMLLLALGLAACSCEHEWKGATCAQPAVCTRCGITEGRPLGHNWADATCAAPRTCAACGMTQGETLPHTWGEATCAVPRTCRVCAATDGETLPHTWAASTCDAPRTCSVCAATDGQPLGHTWAEATCDTPRTCSVCQATEGKALGHSWSEATCDTPRTCSRCDLTEGRALGHRFAAATCDTPRTCSVCQATEGKALGHSFSAGTCDTPRTCTRCDLTDGQPLGHDWIEASCEKAKHCSRCAATEGKALGHRFAAATCEKPRTCTTCGGTTGYALGHTWTGGSCTTARKCKTCGAADSKPLGHNWNAATCTAPKTCAVCGTTEGGALGHNWNAATCTSPKLCARCSAAEGAALGHSWTLDSILERATSTKVGQRKMRCTTCSATQNEAYAAQILKAAEIADLGEKSIGILTAYNKKGAVRATGIAFVISADGRVVTSYQLIQGAASAKVTLNGSTYSVANVCAYSEQSDLAVLTISASGLTPLDLQPAGVKRDELVYAYGSGTNSRLTHASGAVTQAEKVVDGVCHIQHDTVLGENSLGGPLFNAYGEVVGINTTRKINGIATTLAVSAAELDRLSYGQTMTFSAFYDKTFDAFAILREYIMKEGIYYADDDEYLVPLVSGTYLSFGVMLSGVRFACYCPKTETFELVMSLSGTGKSEYVRLTMKKNASAYEWYYANQQYELQGSIAPNQYRYHDPSLNITSSSPMSVSDKILYRDYAGIMMRAMLTEFKSDFAAIGITPGDIGFAQYD